MQHIYLIGDSLTQQGYASGWATMVADKFVRTAEVHNAGLSGYNTTWVLKALRGEPLIPGVPAAPYCPKPAEPVLVATVFLGANDAATESCPQSVPVSDFKANLTAIVKQVQKDLNPKHGVVVITAPPVDGEAWRRFAELKYGPCPTPNRLTSRTRDFRNAAIEVSKEVEGCVCFDTFAALMGAENADTQNCTDDIRHPWMDLYEDGLHFNAKGGAIIGEGLLKVFHSIGLDGETLPFALPPFLDIVAGAKA